MLFDCDFVFNKIEIAFVGFTGAIVFLVSEIILSISFSVLIDFGVCDLSKVNVKKTNDRNIVAWLNFDLICIKK